MQVFQLRKYFLIGVALVVGRAEAQSINWYSTPLQASLTSTGQNMDETFQFQLGVFSGGFVPTASNTNQWSSYWVSADSTSYNPDSKAFDDTFSVTGNPAPFTTGAKAYVWGRSTGAAKDESILFRKSDWTWPAYDPMSPFSIPWNAATADEVILGKIEASGSPFLMKSEAVYSYAQWRDGTLAGVPLNGPNDDPDRDGVSNLLEFVSAHRPHRPQRLPPRRLRLSKSPASPIFRFPFPACATGWRPSLSRCRATSFNGTPAAPTRLIFPIPPRRWLSGIKPQTGPGCRNGSCA